MLAAASVAVAASMLAVLTIGWTVRTQTHGEGKHRKPARPWRRSSGRAADAGADGATTSLQSLSQGWRQL